jgi:hypothetical protein
MLQSTRAHMLTTGRGLHAGGGIHAVRHFQCFIYHSLRRSAKDLFSEEGSLTGRGRGVDDVELASHSSVHGGQLYTEAENTLQAIPPVGGRLSCYMRRLGYASKTAAPQRRSRTHFPSTIY